MTPMLSAHVSGGRLVLCAHEDELRRILDAVDLDVEVESVSPCG